MVELDNNALTHLLGYLTPKQWADALSSKYALDRTIIKKLIAIQEKAYGYELIRDIMGEI